jgi:hypothetical protein
MKHLCFLLLTLLTTQSAFPVGTKGDFDGDGKTDITVIRNYGMFDLQHFWWILKSSDGGVMVIPWGRNESATNTFDTALVGDFDGDGKSDFAFWRHRSTSNPQQTHFYILRSSDFTYQIVPWGVDQDVPVIQDYDGDGKDDIAVVRVNIWWIIQSRDGIRVEQGGCCTPHAGDYDGDGKGDLAASFTGPETGFFRLFFIKKSSTGILETTSFGLFQDYVTPGDYDGDGKTDLAVWRGRNVVDGNWYWLRSSDGQIGGVKFGGGSPLFNFAVPGDYDGDGKTDPAIAVADGLQTSNFQFWILGSSAGLSVTHWGLTPLNPDEPLMRLTITN